MHEDELKVINNKRDEKNKIVRSYQEAFLNIKLSTAVEQCFSDWENLSYNVETLKNYRRYIDELDKLGILPLEKKVKVLEIESSFVIERLLACQVLSNMQKKIRMHVLIFVFRHIEKESFGKIKSLKMPLELSKIGPIKDINRKAATYDEVIQIINASRLFSLRDSLVLELIYYTQRPLLEILKLNSEQIDFEYKIILNTIIDEEVIERLKNYFESTALIRGSSSYFFITNNGNPLCRTIVQKTLTKANKEVHLPYIINTKMIQRSRKIEAVH